MNQTMHELSISCHSSVPCCTGRLLRWDRGMLGPVRNLRMTSTSSRRKISVGFLRETTTTYQQHLPTTIFAGAFDGSFWCRVTKQKGSMHPSASDALSTWWTHSLLHPRRMNDATMQLEEAIRHAAKGGEGVLVDHKFVNNWMDLWR